MNLMGKYPLMPASKTANTLETNVAGLVWFFSPICVKVQC